jgi:hypothetical protein
MENNDHLKAVLNPNRFQKMPPAIKATIGYILEMKVTIPSISRMCVDSDGELVAMVNGDKDYNDKIVPIADFKAFWKVFVRTPEFMLSGDEIAYLDELPSVMIRNYGE